MRLQLCFAATVIATLDTELDVGTILIEIIETDTTNAQKFNYVDATTSTCTCQMAQISYTTPSHELVFYS